MRQFLKSLTPDQVDALMSVLRPEQSAVIGEVYDAYPKREATNEEATKMNGAKKNGAAH